MIWTPDQDAKLRQYVAQGLSYSDCAWALNGIYGVDDFTKDACSGRHGRLLQSVPLAAYDVAEPMPRYHAWFDADGQLIFPAAGKPDLGAYLEGLANLTRRVQILHISDLHVPLHDMPKLSAALTEWQGADLVVVAGDAMEIYAYSRFPKNRHIPIEREIEAWMGVQEYLANNFPLVVVIDSNHLNRIRIATSAIPAGLQFLVEPDLMRYLAQPYENIIVVPDWWVQIGDAIFSHGDYSKGRAPKTAEAVGRYLHRFGAAGQLPVEPFRLLVQAHTHRVGTLYECGVKYIESGCLAKLPLDYSVAPNAIAFATPQTNGYVVVVQEGGRTLLNESREHVFDLH